MGVCSAPFTSQRRNPRPFVIAHISPSALPYQKNILRWEWAPANHVHCRQLVEQSGTVLKAFETPLTENDVLVHSQR